MNYLPCESCVYQVARFQICVHQRAYCTICHLITSEAHSTHSCLCSRFLIREPGAVDKEGGTDLRRVCRKLCVNYYGMCIICYRNSIVSTNDTRSTLVHVKTGLVYKQMYECLYVRPHSMITRIYGLTFLLFFFYT